MLTFSQQHQVRQGHRLLLVEGDDIGRLPRRLDAMYRVNPHFLFNALNSIEALSREAPARIPELVRGLSEYLRHLLRTTKDGLTTLQQEMDAVAGYVRVEKIRFEDQLQFELEIAEAARRRCIPEFLLQSLVENAVVNGMRTSPMPLRVVVSARCLDGRILLEVRNTGTWRASKVDGDSWLENLQRRLDLVYKEDGYRLTTGETAEWSSITVDMPASEE